MRYSSFTRYFGHLKRLGWVEETGKTEPSGLQDYYSPAPSRVYYRLTEAGKEATLAEVSNPLRLLYPEFDSVYFKEKRSGRHYYSKKKR
jgi:DNA-binding PadR family transcriptional regulator